LHTVHQEEVLAWLGTDKIKKKLKAKKLWILDMHQHFNDVTGRSPYNSYQGRMETDCTFALETGIPYQNKVF
jgi:hypothetical protein